MPEVKRFIVGRQKELALAKDIITGNAQQFLLNIYGPGGIGKTVLAEKIKDYCLSNEILFAEINGDSQLLTEDRILYKIREDFAEETLLAKLHISSAFSDFDQKLNDYLIQTPDTLLKI